MRILFLGYSDSPLIDFLRDDGNLVNVSEGASPAFAGYDFLISYGYRHILAREVIDNFPDRAINLHISYLPWNRGADPNLWSWIDDTPKGVTIHHIAPAVDAGDIIVQREVHFSPDTTLAESYRGLHLAIQSLFREMWPLIRSHQAPRIKQPAGGSFHRRRDRALVQHLLTEGWDTPVLNLCNRFVAHSR